MDLTLWNKILALAAEQFGTEPEYLWARTPGYAVLRHPNGKWYAVLMDLPRSKLGLAGDGPIAVVNLQCAPSLSGSLRLHPGILPGYHMNKEKWITVLLDGTVDFSQLEALLSMSYSITGAKSRRPKHTTSPQA